MRPTGQAPASAVDAGLARAVAERRDRAAFASIYDRHAPAVYGVARRVIRDAALAEDVVQEVFLTLWTATERFDPARGTLRSYLLTMVHHRAVDAVRRAASRYAASLDSDRETGEPVEAVLDTVLRLADADQVQRAIAALPPAQRDTLLLAYWGGHTQAEIADLTGVPLGTVKSRAFSAVTRLRGLLTLPGGPVMRGTG